eukprot:TRINITY_DN7632_c0_g1_i1.p1 TRINITY_DN7632_c0_g1~~TRINITY_DN7632_c0_g1_i1.p1  ORF type:complete len:293 (+),score=39.40 TRINITY_DN7632_c0_g1_i1:44-880(+)
MSRFSRHRPCSSVPNRRFSRCLCFALVVALFANQIDRPHLPVSFAVVATSNGVDSKTSPFRCSFRRSGGLGSVDCGGVIAGAGTCVGSVGLVAAVHAAGAAADSSVSSHMALPDGFSELSELPLDFDLDLKLLGDELTADTWTDSTLPIALLKRDGAVKIKIEDWKDGQTRTVSYKLPVLPGGIGARVENKYTIRADSDTALSVEISSVTYAPVIENMSVNTYYKLTKEGEALRLQVGGRMTWSKTPPKLFASPIERGIRKTQAASGMGFIEALKGRL